MSIPLEYVIGGIGIAITFGPMGYVMYLDWKSSRDALDKWIGKEHQWK